MALWTWGSRFSLGLFYPTGELMMQGEVDIIQLCAEGYPSSQVRALACSLALLLTDIPLVLNDYPQLVTETGRSFWLPRWIEGPFARQNHGSLLEGMP